MRMPNHTTNETSASASESRPSAKRVRLSVKMTEISISAKPMPRRVQIETQAARLASSKICDFSKKWLGNILRGGLLYLRVIVLRQDLQPATRACRGLAARVITKMRATAGVWKQNHRFRCIISGSFTDSDTPDIVRDFFWEHNTATGVKTFRNSNPFISGATSGAHNAAEVPFEASHNYNVIVEKTGATGACIVSCDNAPFNLPNTVGSITVDIEDLGEFAS